MCGKGKRASDYSVVLRVLVRKGEFPSKDCLLEESCIGWNGLSPYPHHTQSLVASYQEEDSLFVNFVVNPKGGAINYATNSRFFGRRSEQYTFMAK